MPYNKKGRFQNGIRTYSQSKESTDTVSLSNAPKSNHYRDELQPFIGSCIEVIGRLDDVEKEKKYNRLLLKDVRIDKVPSKVRTFIPESNFDHIYVAVSKDFLTENRTSIRVRGFVYEYLSQGKKNIGIQAVTIKNAKE